MAAALVRESRVVPALDRYLLDCPGSLWLLFVTGWQQPPLFDTVCYDQMCSINDQLSLPLLHLVVSVVCSLHMACLHHDLGRCPVDIFLEACPRHDGRCVSVTSARVIGVWQDE